MEIMLYRIKEGEYYKGFEEKFRKELIKAFGENFDTKITDDHKQLLRDIHYKLYGGPWNYNQIVGAIKIYQNNMQILREIWLSQKKRYRGVMKNKKIYSSGNIFKFTVCLEMANEEISNELKEYIIDETKYNKRIVPDLECFDNICDFIDWKRLVTDNNCN